jgi:putative proteasome-type protease
MRSNVTVGPPIDLVVYGKDDLELRHYRRFVERDPDLMAIHAQWEQSLRKAVQELPPIEFGMPPPPSR